MLTRPDTLKLYIKAQGTKTMNLVINLDDDESLLFIDDQRSLASYGCGNILPCTHVSYLDSSRPSPINSPITDMSTPCQSTKQRSPSSSFGNMSRSRQTLNRYGELLGAHRYFTVFPNQTSPRRQAHWAFAISLAILRNKLKRGVLARQSESSSFVPVSA